MKAKKLDPKTLFECFDFNKDGNLDIKEITESLKCLELSYSND
jgi:Ca2+-binding EF-hand superfamily protein